MIPIATYIPDPERHCKSGEAGRESLSMVASLPEMAQIKIPWLL